MILGSDLSENGLKQVLIHTHSPGAGWSLDTVCQSDLVSKGIQLVMILDDTSSICSSVPSISDLDEELAHYTQLLEGDIIRTALDVTEVDEDDINSCLSAAKKEEQEVTKLDRLLMPPPSSSCFPIGPRPTAASLGIKESIEECMKINDDDAGKMSSILFL